MAVGFNFVGNGLRTCFLGSYTVSFPRPSSVIKGRISSFFFLGKTTTHISEDSDNPLDNSGVAVVDTAPLPWCHFGTLPLVYIAADR